MEIISGIIEKITFRNEANAYTVAVLKTKDEQIVVVGTLPFINEGDSVELEGEYTVHATYGEQFKVQSFTQKTPENSAAILRYLSSGAIKGVGPTTATRLVEKFGADNIILAKCIDAKAVKWGVKYGIRNFQGPYMDAMEVALIKAECPAGEQCKAEDCLKRRRLLARKIRLECPQKDYLEKMLG